MPEETSPTTTKSTLKESGATPGEEQEQVVIQREAEKDLLTWEAPPRPFKRRNREFYVSILAIAGIAGLILFLIEGFIPVILIISLVFLFYVLSSVEPENIEYKITNRGFRIAGKRIDWQYLIRFWFSRRFDNELLIIETVGIPGRMELVINPGDKEAIKKTISAYLLEEEAPPSYLDRAISWFSEKIPGNK